MKLQKLLFVFVFLFSSYFNGIQANDLLLPISSSISEIDSSPIEGLKVLPPVSSCDGSTEILDATDPLAVSYEWNEEVPLGSGTFIPFVPPQTNATLSVTATGNYRVQITYADASSFFDLYTVTFFPVPIVDAPAEDIVSCSDGIFDLTVNNSIILGAQDPLVYEVRYFETLGGSQLNVGAINPDTAYDGSLPPTRPIFARIHNIANTDCFALTDFIINFTPVTMGGMTDLPICDLGGDGVENLDLAALKDAEALGGQNPADYTVTYHGSPSDADADANAHGNPHPAAAPLETIWVRVENNANTDCYVTDSFDVIISTIPIPVNPLPLEECDILEEPGALVNNGIAIFNLFETSLEIIGTNTNVTPIYFEDLTNAQAGIIDIFTPAAYVNTTAGTQTIYVRLQNNENTDCFGIVSLQLIVNPIPDGPGLYPVDGYTLEQCDENEFPGVGEEVFDLTQYQNDITGGQAWNLTYHTSPEGADLGILDPDFIFSPTIYINTALNETIYIRVSMDITDPDTCYVIIELQLILNLLPVTTRLDIEDPLIICEIDTDGRAIFDFTSTMNAILNAQDIPLDNVVTFYLRPNWAEIPINAIDPIDSFESGNRPIYVRIDNIVTGCYTTALSFDIEVREGATANRPLEAFTVCDQEPFDGFEEFDLTDPDLIAEILGGQVGPYMTEFYISPENAIDEQDPISPFYTNVINPQLVYVRVTNTETECFDIASVILKVELPPVINLEDSYRLCVDENGLPIQEEDGEQSPPLIDTELDPRTYTFVWVLNGIIVGANPSIIANQEGVYTVTVTEISTTCSATASTTVTLSSPPLIYDAVVTSDAFDDIHTIIATVDPPTAGGIGEYEFQLDDGPFQDDGNFIDIRPGNHVVTIRDKFGCGSVTIELGVIDYPRFVTPNEDGFHDTWNILGISIGDPNAQIYIFDRFGKLITQISPSEAGWDGTYNGNPLPSSDYWFRIEYTERDQAGNDMQKEFRGHFSLKR